MNISICDTCRQIEASSGRDTADRDPHQLVLSGREALCLGI